MTILTTDPNDPRLGHGSDDKPVPQNEVYLVLSDEERAKLFVRPVRESYRHVGPPGPEHPLRDLTENEQGLYSKLGYVKLGYVKYEKYPGNDSPVGRFWTQAQLDSIGQGCGLITTMGDALAETYARYPKFYGATYCCHCQKHRPVGQYGEFVWLDGSRVGT